MAVAYLTKQVQGTSGTATFATLYETGASTTAVVSAIHICNESATTSGTVWVGIAASATSPTSGQWLAAGWAIPTGETLTWNGPMTLGNTAFIRVSSAGTALTFTAAVAEVS